MKKIFFSILVLFIISAGCGKPAKSRGISVLSGNSMITAMVLALDDGVDVINLVPPAACPGHFDMKPSDAEKIAGADVFIIQPFMSGLAEKVRKINPRIKTAVIETVDLTIPENYLAALMETEKILAGLNPEKAEFYAENRVKEAQKTAALVSGAEEILSEIRQKKPAAIASRFQAGFAAWAGFEIIDTFGDPDSLTIKNTEETIKRSKDSGAEYIISNFSGTHGTTAEVFKKALGVKEVVFYNFPDTKHLGRGFYENFSRNISAAAGALGIEGYGK